MAMSTNLGDRERHKFVETSDGETAVRVQNTIVDVDGDVAEVNSDGSINVKDNNILIAMNRILSQLQIMNLHLSLISNNELSKKDI